MITQWRCSRCDTLNQSGHDHCLRCGAGRSPVLERIAEAPTPPVTISAGAGFGIRFLARLIDVVCGFVISLIVGIGTGVFLAILGELGLLDDGWMDRVDRDGPFDFAIGMVGMFLYFTFSEGLGSATLGKLVCGLRVVKLDGSPVTMKAAFVRDLAYHIDALFFGLVGLASMQKSSLQQRYGDVWAGTVVVSTKVFIPVPNPGPLRLLIGVGAGSLAYALVIFSLLAFRAFGG